MDTRDLDVLAAAAAQGDRDALTGLIQATQRDVSRFLARVSHRRDIDDMTQETFLRAFRALAGFEGRSSVRTWLFAIAHRVAVDAERHASARPRNAARVDGESVDFRQPASFEEQHALRDLLAGLSPDRREAFVLTQVAGLSYLEAAEVGGCPVGTIRSRVARAREDLVIALGDARPHRRTAT